MKTAKGGGDRKAAEAPSPAREIQWAWGLAALLLITVAFTSHQLTQAQEQLEKSESEIVSLRTVRTSAASAHPDIAKIIVSLKRVDQAAGLRDEQLGRRLNVINSRLEVAVAKTNSLEFANSSVSQLQNDLEVARKMLDRVIAELETPSGQAPTRP